MTREQIVQKLSARRDAIASGALVPPPYVGSDFALNDLDQPPVELRAAAVLVPLVDRAGVLSVLLTQRTEDMPSHAGQIAFPGGRKQAEDPSLVVTALRETEEEVGIDRSFVEVVGPIDTYVTRTGYAVTPIIGFVRPAFTLKPDPREVADIFEVPLDFFLDPANHHVHSRTWQGRERRYYAMPYGERYVWGATAGMIKNLYHILAEGG
jgi:8-oxo-dGTP pyrophosphatase MutT (NUDIX family)